MATVTVIVLGSRAVTKAADTDDGTCDADCSLREAMGAANSGDSIDVPAGTFTLTLGALPTITQNLTLTGAGADNTVIQASTESPQEGGVADYRVFTITDGAVNISGMTLRHGGTLGNGGAILNTTTLDLTGVWVTGNLADRDGGGVSNAGTLTVTDSTVSGNSATERGAASTMAATAY